VSPAAHLRAISPAATPDEVAAIVAAIEASTAVAAAPPADDDGSVHEWVRGARLQARRSGLQRGPWRLSARLARRPRD
jgi:hypothetical protein